MSKRLIIIGNTGNAKLAHYYFSKDSDYEVCVFSVNKEYIDGKEFCGLPVVPFEDVEKNFPPEKYDAFVAIGYKNMNAIRKDKYDQVKKKGYFLPNYISSKCAFLTQEPIGENNLILEHNTIQPFTRIGNNNVLWSGNHIGHDVTIGNHCFITSHVVVSGFTVIRDNCFLGVNSTLRDAIEIAPYSLIGAGAVIMKSTKEGEVYLAPKPIKLDKKSTSLKIS